MIERAFIVLILLIGGAGIGLSLAQYNWYYEGASADAVPLWMLNKDFANYWIAGRLVLSGNTDILFGNNADFMALSRALLGNDYPLHNWSYPPHYLFLIWPVGLLAYGPSLITFLATTLALYFLAVRKLAGENWFLSLMLSALFLLVNTWAAQNGLLISGIALLSLAFRQTRPILAGLLLALVTVKPQLGILFPLLLVFERNWSMILATAGGTLLLVAASVLAFGTDAWAGYFREVVPQQEHVITNGKGFFLAMMPQTFGGLRFLGMEADLALTVHMAVAVLAISCTIYAFRIVDDPDQRTAVLGFSTFIASPYTLNYDLGIALAPLALLAACKSGLWARWPGRAAIVAGSLTPVITGIPAALVFSTLLGLSVWAARQSREQSGGSALSPTTAPTIRSGSPTAASVRPGGG